MFCKFPQELNIVSDMSFHTSTFMTGSNTLLRACCNALWTACDVHAATIVGEVPGATDNLSTVTPTPRTGKPNNGPVDGVKF